MHIISGKYKKCRLRYPLKGEMRPTQNHVKESIFNIVGDVNGKKVLDLCCGTGQNGLEAISRGASYVTFVDIDIRYVIQNVNHIVQKEPAIKARIQIKKKDCRRFISEGSKEIKGIKGVNMKGGYDLVFFDPPWMMTSLYEDTLNGLFEFDILSSSGSVVCEHPKSMRVPTILNNQHHFYDQYYYGNTGLTIVGRV
jgi:16S rRNA (guanine966-N2)-methyltransferase